MITLLINVQGSSVIKLGIRGCIYELKGGVLPYSIYRTESHDRRK